MLTVLVPRGRCVGDDVSEHRRCAWRRNVCLPSLQHNRSRSKRSGRRRWCSSRGGRSGAVGTSRATTRRSSGSCGSVPGPRAADAVPDVSLVSGCRLARARQLGSGGRAWRGGDIVCREPAAARWRFCLAERWELRRYRPRGSPRVSTARPRAPITRGLRAGGNGQADDAAAAEPDRPCHHRRPRPARAACAAWLLRCSASAYAPSALNLRARADPRAQRAPA
jgi:hypothetical protein